MMDYAVIHENGKQKQKHGGGGGEYTSHWFASLCNFVCLACKLSHSEGCCRAQFSWAAALLLSASSSVASSCKKQLLFLFIPIFTASNLLLRC